VDAVAFDTRCEHFADGAFGGVRWIGGAHGVAPLFDGVGGFEDQHYYRAFGHEFYQRGVEGAFLMNGVKVLGFQLA